MSEAPVSPDYPGQIEPPLLILAVVFVGAGLLFTYLFGQQTTLTCTRLNTLEQCTLQTSWMNLVPLHHRSIEGIRSASVEESCDEDGCTYRVLIRTERDEIPLGQAFSSGMAPKQRKADQINAFASQQKNELKVSEGGGWWVLFPLIFVIIGIGIIYRPLWATLRPMLQRPS